MGKRKRLDLDLVWRPESMAVQPWRWEIVGRYVGVSPAWDGDHTEGVLIKSARVWSGRDDLEFYCLRVVIGNKLCIHSPVWFLRHVGEPLSLPLWVPSTSNIEVQIIGPSEDRGYSPSVELTGVQLRRVGHE